MGNFFTLFDSNNELEVETSVVHIDEPSKNIEIKDVEINGNEYELLQEEKETDTIEQLSEHISKQILKEIFEEIKKRNPVIEEVDENESISDENDTLSQNKKIVNVVKTEVKTDNLHTFVKTNINNNETRFVLPKGESIKTEIDNFGNVTSTHYKNTKAPLLPTPLPKFYPNITSLPYKFPPKPAPIIFKNKPLLRKNPKFSLWGNAYMDTKRLNINKPKINYIPSTLNNNIKFKKD